MAGALGLEATSPLLDQWTASTRTYETPVEGTFITELYPDRVNFRMGGTWHEIEPELIPGGDLDLVARQNSIEVEFSTDSSDTALASVEVPSGQSVSFGVAGADPAHPDVEGAVARYESVLPDVDITLESLPTGVKETLELASPSAPRVFRFPMDIDGLVPSIESSSVIFRDGTGRPRLMVPPGFMEDSAPEPAFSDAVEYRLVDDGSVLEVSLGNEWLDDPARQYPVLVDPSLLVYSGNDDTFVNSGSTGNRSTLAYLRVGQGTHMNRAFMHFDTSAIEGMNIHSASLELWQYGSGSCSPTPMEVYPVFETWAGSTTTTWPGPAVDTEAPAAVISSGVGHDGSCPGGLVSGDVTQLVDDWSFNARVNYGLTLRAQNESLATQFKEFYSAQSYLPPNITVTWSDPTLSSAPSQPEGMSPEGWTTESSPVLSAMYSDPQGDAGKLTFILYDGLTGAHLSSLHSSTVASGTTASATVPSLALDAPIRYRVVAVDMVNGRYSEMSRHISLVRPSSWISSPEPGGTVDGASQVVANLAAGVSAEAVNLLVDGELAGSDGQAPYGWDDAFAGLPDGFYELSVELSGGSAHGSRSPSVVVAVGEENWPEGNESGEPSHSGDQRSCKRGEVCFWRWPSFNANANKHFRDFCNANTAGTCGQYQQRYLHDNYWYNANTGNRLAADLVGSGNDGDIESIANKRGQFGGLCVYRDPDFGGGGRYFPPGSRNGALGPWGDEIESMRFLISSSTSCVP